MARDQYPEKGLNGLLADWQAWSVRDSYRKNSAEAEAEGNTEAARILRDAAAEERPVEPLEALAANAELCRLLTGWRWIAMRDAWERGATWEQISDAVGLTKREAQTAYLKTIEGQERHCARWFPPEESARYRAALDGTELDIKEATS